MNKHLAFALPPLLSFRKLLLVVLSMIRADEEHLSALGVAAGEIPFLVTICDTICVFLAWFVYVLSIQAAPAHPGLGLVLSFIFQSHLSEEWTSNWIVCEMLVIKSSSDSFLIKDGADAASVESLRIFEGGEHDAGQRTG